MPVVQLSQSMLQTLKPLPGKPRTEYCDDAHGVPGLYVLVSAGSPIMTFYLRYKDATAKTCHQKIGRTSEISLADARKQAKVLKAEITANGRDPRAEAKAQKAVLTLDEFWSQHYLPFATPRKRSIKRDEIIFRLQIQPTLGKLRLNQITRQQILSLMAKHKANGLAEATADQIGRLARRMLGLAVQWDMLDVNQRAILTMCQR